MKLMAYYLKKLSLWLLPYVCVLCGKLSKRLQDICPQCLNELPKLPTACPRCAKPVTPGLLCPFCLKENPFYDNTYALFIYQSPITHLIMNLKFGQNLTFARILGELLAEQIKNQWYRNLPLPEAIIPIPLHPLRLKERGFNQAVEIARPVAKQLRLPVVLNKCQRVKYTSAQAMLPARDRVKNTQNAFQISPDFSYRHVAVIDDVITTGQTMNEFCRTLKLAGVEKIDVWCCARSIQK